MASTVRGRYLDIRLLLEGIECDVTSIKVSCGVNQPGQAVITIPAADAAHKFLPRTLVHLFYFDSRYELGTSYGEDGFETRPPGVYDGSKLTKEHEKLLVRLPDGSTESQDITDQAVLLSDKNNWRNWKLLFTGEILGYSFSKVAGRREIILVCQDFTSYWDNCRLYWGKKRSSVFSSYKTSIFSGATQLYRGKSKVDSHRDLVRLLQKRPSSMPNVPGLMGGIFTILESAVGSFSPERKKKFRGCNDFLTQAEIRLKLTRQVGASTKDDTSSTFISSNSFRRYLYRVSKATSYTATFMQFVNMLMGKIYHVWNSQSAPSYFAEGGTVESKETFPDNVKYKYHGELGLFQRHVKDTLKRAAKANSDGDNRRRENDKLGVDAIPHNMDYIKWLFNPDTDALEVDTRAHEKFDSLNGSTGVMSPKIGSDQKVYREINDHPLHKKGGIVAAGIRKKAGKNSTANNKAARIQKAYTKAARAANECARIQFIQTDGFDHANGSTQGPNYDKALSAASAASIGHNKVSYHKIRKNCEDALRLIRSAFGKPIVTKKVARELNDRLFTTYFHPDLYMCPPPKCNVLFPDHIQSISFSRNWMSEISRLWLHGRTESGKNQKDCYFSPNATMLMGPTPDDCDQAVKKGGGFIMRHEKYTGIIPSIVGLGDADIFKKLHKADVREAKKEAKKNNTEFDLVDIAGTAKFSPQPHLQRAANYMFFAARHSTRTMRVVCRYSPQLVAGMPCLVLDPVRAQSRFQVRKEVNTVGESTGLAGSLSLATPTPKLKETLTTVTGGNSFDEKGTWRPPGTHYVGVIAEIVHIIDIHGGAQTIVSLAKCREYDEAGALFGKEEDEAPPTVKRYSKSQYWKKEKGSFTAQVTHTKASREADAHDGNAENALSSGKVKFRKGARYRVTAFTDPVTGGKVAATGDPNRVNVKVERLVTPAPKGQDVDFNWEASVLPPWFSRIYTPSNIGKEFYQHMYGCKSILDDPPIKTTPGTTADEIAAGTPIKGTDEVTGTATISVKWGEEHEGESTEVLIPADLTKVASSTKDAADKLAETWLSLKEIGASTDLYIDTYVNRKYASLLEVMGNQNIGLILKIYDSGPRLTKQQRGEDKIVGFHGNAYGPYKNMKGTDGESLAPEGLLKIGDKMSDIKKELDVAKIDPRFERHKRIREYIKELRFYGFGRDNRNAIDEASKVSEGVVLPASIEVEEDTVIT
jgi:hypothetical protein